jgi:hypothetical protein
VAEGFVAINAGVGAQLPRLVLLLLVGIFTARVVRRSSSAGVPEATPIATTLCASMSSSVDRTRKGVMHDD